VDAAIIEYRPLNPYATGDKLAVSGEVNRMITAAIPRLHAYPRAGCVTAHGSNGGHDRLVATDLCDT
jgi:hypothetical protein